MTIAKISHLLTVAIVATGTSQLYAEDTDASKLWSGETEFGYVDTSGTEETTIKARAAVNREADKWRYNITFDSLNTTASDQRSAEKYFLSNRLAYQYDDNNFSFAYASYDDDRFSGFDYQATFAAGWGRRLLNNEIMKWDVEVGPGYRISKVDDGATGEDSDEVIIRGFTQYSWDFSETANFSQSLNVEAGADNTISKSITALKVQIIGALAMKLSYTIKYTDDVPAATKHADTETAVTVVYSF